MQDGTSENINKTDQEQPVKEQAAKELPTVTKVEFELLEQEFQNLKKAFFSLLKLYRLTVTKENEVKKI